MQASTTRTSYGISQHALQSTYYVLLCPAQRWRPLWPPRTLGCCGVAAALAVAALASARSQTPPAPASAFSSTPLAPPMPEYADYSWNGVPALPFKLVLLLVLLVLHQPRLALHVRSAGECNMCVCSTYSVAELAIALAISIYLCRADRWLC